MSAVLEDVIDPVANWRMPQISIGDNVVWYPGGDRSLQPSCARVTHWSDRCVELRVEGRDQQFKKYSVRHIDDPALRNNDNLKAFGAWDYTAQYRDIARRLEALEDVAGIEDAKKAKGKK